jgi:5'(3')-deoxyribonucleotidase
VIPNDKHVAVDLDDVVLDFLGGVLASVNMERGSSLTREDITEWNLHPILDPILGENFWDWLERKDWLWANFSAVPGAIGGLEQLRRKGYYLECLTSKPDWAEHNVWKWLGKWRPPFQRVTIVNQESKVRYSDARWLIDDKPRNCIEWMAEGRDAILFDRPHNRRPQTVAPFSSGKMLVRCTGWEAVLEHIFKINGAYR